ncbi:MAG: rRNA adenine N-6-methyltransferase family protein [Candidatus Caldarchaeum sp.]
MGLARLKADQHFLIDKNVVDRLVDVSEVSGDDVVLDVGAGTGVVTEKLAEKAKMVYAVELDKTFEPQLARLAARYGNIRVFWGSFLGLKLPLYNKVVSNPPFSMLEPLLQRHLRKPVPMSLIAPLRFAQTLTSERYVSLLSFRVQLAYRSRVMDVLDGSVFSPPYPGKACILLLTPLDLGEAERLMMIFFSQNGSKVRNALRNVFWSRTSKREAIKLVELSNLSDGVLNKRVCRITLNEAIAVYELIKRVVLTGI